MASRYVTKNGRTAKRGIFMGGVWHCDCDSRLPADKFQTKNGGKNHGRWFYTCQKPQPSKCGFFLWEDDAKVREEGAVLANSRTEPTSPRTPKKIGKAVQTKLTSPVQLATPSTKSRSPVKLEAVPPPVDIDNAWSSDSVNDEDLASALEEFETPRKAGRTDVVTSPGKKRTTSAISAKSDASSVTLPPDHEADDVFCTPATIKKPGSALFPLQPTGLASPNITPSMTVHKGSTATGTATESAEAGPLATSALQLLQPTITLPTQLETQLIDLLNRHELRAAGVAKGREITRLAVQAKERKIAELEARIHGLEQEKETMRSVVQCLKSDIATSPKRPRRPRTGSGTGGEELGGTSGAGGVGGRGRGRGRGDATWARSIV
ncbi:uncharacterized protein HMPREF1541_08243 [Cyphellophora europaea CBS 101466]|uniref:GRF-type domain-containing protein n=1 Tax=Cyphellophora europaea (strain CBS 101466) TaxID=1220924 RepID=W2RL93_CYPE1|nr:uncharacterized protein HMPREF1541_08243 [Cyphellophora europaea CBS 101466]ETN37252.1 hypothetical protein HMPREF1541_08243 [Cyphellophora europaea CBS 101466]